MPLIRSLISKHSTHHFKLVAVIFLLSEIMLTCSCCAEKKLVYIIIIALFSRQPSFYFECTKANIYSFCNMRLVPVNKYIFSTFSCLFVFPHSLSVNT